jgi:hypothetical protein
VVKRLAAQQVELMGCNQAFMAFRVSARQRVIGTEVLFPMIHETCSYAVAVLGDG